MERQRCEDVTRFVGTMNRNTNGTATRETYGALEANAAIQKRNSNDTEKIVQHAIALKDASGY